MSSSVIIARTRMWRTMVAIMRGGNLWGAAWQRLQFVRNRCSPCTRMASASALLCATGVLMRALSFSLLRGGPAAYNDDTSANTMGRIVTLVFIVPPRVLEERQNGKRFLLSKDSHFHRN